MNWELLNLVLAVSALCWILVWAVVRDRLGSTYSRNSRVAVIGSMGGGLLTCVLGVTFILMALINNRPHRTFEISVGVIVIILGFWMLTARKKRFGKDRL